MVGWMFKYSNHPKSSQKKDCSVSPPRGRTPPADPFAAACDEWYIGDQLLRQGVLPADRETEWPISIPWPPSKGIKF